MELASEEQQQLRKENKTVETRMERKEDMDVIIRRKKGDKSLKTKSSASQRHGAYIVPDIYKQKTPHRIDTEPMIYETYTNKKRVQSFLTELFIKKSAATYSPAGVQVPQSVGLNPLCAEWTKDPVEHRKAMDTSSHSKTTI